MAKAVLSEQAAASTQNIYQLDGKVPLLKAIPFGLQHILAMFVANLTPITLIGAASGLDHAQIAVLLQNAMFVAGIATLIQLYPIWKIGSRLPVVMGVSFTFVTILSYVGTTYGYPTVMGAVLIGGLIEGTLGLLAKYWRKIITPVVAASVVTAIGYSLFTVGTRSFGEDIRRILVPLKTCCSVRLRWWHACCSISLQKATGSSFRCWQVLSSVIWLHLPWAW